MRHQQFLAVCLPLISCIAVSRLQAAPITATVVGPTGAPIKGAHVVISRAGLFDKVQDTELQTDDNGRFTAEVPELPNSAAPNHPVKFLIAAPGLAVSGGSWKKGETVFRLEPGLTLSGTVVDETGKPVADSPVSLRSVRGKNVRDTSDRIDIAPWLKVSAENFLVKSGADGRWSIPNVPREGRASIRFDDPRYVSDSMQVDLSPNMPAAPPFIARPGVRIGGRLRYETGQPAVGVWVSASGAGINGTASTQTTADGSYLLPAMPFGRFVITAQDGSGDWVAAKLRGESTPQMQTMTVPELMLQRGVLLSGTVLDVDTGEPIAGAYAHADGDQSIMFSRPTDAAGRYQLRVLPGKIRLSLPGIPVEYLRKGFRPLELNITPEQTQLPPFRLKRGLALAGRAVDEAGRPATGARIRITTNPRRRSFLEDNIGWVDAQGTWVIKGIDMDQMAESLLTTDEPWETTPVPLLLPTDRPLALTLRRLK